MIQFLHYLTILQKQVPKILKKISKDVQKKGLELLNKAFELDPIPQGQSTSDNRIKDLILGYFFAEDFNKVIELSFDIRKMEHQ